MAETDRISSLPNGELMAELKRFGDESVPVTSGTRRMLENRLKQHLCGNEATDADSNQGMKPVTPVVGSDTPAASAAAVAHTPPPVTVTTDSSMSESTVFFGVQVPSDADCTEGKGNILYFFFISCKRNVSGDRMQIYNIYPPTVYI